MGSLILPSFPTKSSLFCSVLLKTQVLGHLCVS